MCYLISNKIAQFSNLYHSVIKFLKNESNVDHFLQMTYLWDCYVFLASNWTRLYFTTTSWFSIATLQLFKGSVVKHRNTAVRCYFYRCMFKEVGFRRQNAFSYLTSQETMRHNSYYLNHGWGWIMNYPLANSLPLSTQMQTVCHRSAPHLNNEISGTRMTFAKAPVNMDEGCRGWRGTMKNPQAKRLHPGSTANQGHGAFSDSSIRIKSLLTETKITLSKLWKW